jgi:hypothetical protein
VDQGRIRRFENGLRDGEECRKSPRRSYRERECQDEDDTEKEDEEEGESGESGPSVTVGICQLAGLAYELGFLVVLRL